MDENNLNQCHRKSIRLRSWDYGSNGKYFVTICTKNQLPYFGKIQNSILITTPIGDYATKCWYAIPDHYPFIELDAFILMPNHLHGIICIAKREQSEWQQNQFGPQRQNLATVIRGYKSAVTSYAKENSIPFLWHRLFFERIIRNDRALTNIRHYIMENPRRGA